MILFLGVLNARGSDQSLSPPFSSCTITLTSKLSSASQVYIASFVSSQSLYSPSPQSHLYCNVSPSGSEAVVEKVYSVSGFPLEGPSGFSGLFGL